MEGVFVGLMIFATVLSIIGLVLVFLQKKESITETGYEKTKRSRICYGILFVCFLTFFVTSVTLLEIRVRNS